MHSPFVYDLVTKCFYDKTDYSAYPKLRAYRDSLLNSSDVIDITDFGSGSRVFDSNKRTIKAIAKTSGTSLKRSELLHRLMCYLEFKNVLELGTSLGIATHAMALANKDATIVSIEGCPQIINFTSQQLQNYRIENVDLKVGAFSEIIPILEQKTWDLVFFDGHHDKNATLDYFYQILPKTDNESLFILDDIHWSKGMTEAWELIKKHPQATVTIDTFFWGFVFFRREQAKEHFVIRL